MNKSIIILIVLLSIGCTKNNQNDKVVTETAQTDTAKTATINKMDNPYALALKTDTTDKGEQRLIVSIDLYDKSYFVSPHSNGNFLGRFNLSLGETKHLTMKDSIIEFPKSLETYDPWSDGRVNFVKRNTTYTQKLIINSQKDFEVTGLIKFVIEPRCTMEKVKFVISQRSGVLSVEKRQVSAHFGIFADMLCDVFNAGKER
ncbi:hypothetical protein IWQ47_001662 [Aquimarina sp. EL_43]|uniref:hypothetical protein n=1 Tax=unclassified Aquimarina TaxID=2627091 RepID=UPI0018CA640D|nr:MULTISPECIES: hypothetical protein [unclassified Aquimarina]MBG6130255.1 hypothetical protein [Aquimarina sp. EL_35]MBG6149035.1 hypothetical protein [Aquimarina sp. EL_32]MBG6168591.1 hypothetical protein [Aquimarina sp. EL_43]